MWEGRRRNENITQRRRVAEGEVARNASQTRSGIFGVPGEKGKAGEGIWPGDIRSCGVTRLPALPRREDGGGAAGAARDA